MTMQGWKLQLGLALVVLLQVTHASGSRSLEIESSVVTLASDSDSTLINASSEIWEVEVSVDASPLDSGRGLNDTGRRSLLQYRSLQPPPLRTRRGQPCVPSNITIPIFHEGSFTRRLRYPSNQLVRLVLKSNIYFRRGFLFDAGYSCTIITSDGKQRLLGTESSSAQTVRIMGANNIILRNVRIRGRPPTRIGHYDTLRCGVRGDNYWEGHNYWCAAFYVADSWNIWLAKSSIYGRVDVFGSSSVYIDSNYIEGAYNLYSGVLVGNVGDAFKALMANVYITNNKIYANNATCGVALQHSAVGVTVKNNDITGFNQWGVSCGFGVSTNMDCMLSIISFNYIERLVKFPYSGAQAGLYFNTHWTGPGNVAECNYVVNASRCYMFDLSSSGTLVLSGVCIGTVWAFSQNNGNYNMAVNQILVNSHSIGGMNMQNWLGLRCGLSAGNSWNAAMQQMARTPRLKSLFPWLSTDFCTRTTFKGIPCNQRAPGSSYRFYSAAQTSRCSGIPQGNFFHFASLNNKLPLESRFQWENAPPVMPLLNKMDGMEALRPSPTEYLDLNSWGFNNPAKGDFGLRAGSAVLKKYPSFKSCPRSAVGVQRSNSFLKLFNKPKARLRPYRLPRSNFAIPK